MDKPKLSVIMGVYNCKDKNALKESIQSIVNQTYKDWEFIICDDGSQNNTKQILEELSMLDPRIKITGYKNNRGLSYALNYCISQAQGKYIARQDDDDISKPTRFEKEMTFLKANPEYGIVGCIADVYDNNGVWGEYRIPEKPVIKDFLWNSPFLHPSVIMSKEALDKVNYYTDSSSVLRCEDYDLFMKMYSVGIKGYNLQQKLFKYKIEITDKKYRPMKDRITEAKTRKIGFKRMKINKLISMPFIIKPVLIGLIPQRLFRGVRRKSYE